MAQKRRSAVVGTTDPANATDPGNVRSDSTITAPEQDEDYWARMWFDQPVEKKARRKKPKKAEPEIIAQQRANRVARRRDGDPVSRRFDGAPSAIGDHPRQSPSRNEEAAMNWQHGIFPITTASGERRCRVGGISGFWAFSCTADGRSLFHLPSGRCFIASHGGPAPRRIAEEFCERINQLTDWATLPAGGGMEFGQRIWRIALELGAAVPASTYCRRSRYEAALLQTDREK